MNDQKGILSSGLGRVMRNKRYIFWFWLLNLVFALFGTISFNKAAHIMLDHSLVAERLTHGFDLGVFIAMLIRPEFPPMASLSAPVLYFGLVFFLATALFLPGVFLGYSSTYRLPREEFFRACGRNLWRYIRIMIIAGVVMGIIAGLLFAADAAIVKKAGESTNELLPPELQALDITVIFLVMTILRIWFDLAEADAVLNDQRAVRKSIGAGFRHTFRGLGRLLGSYILSTIVAAVILLGGIWIWIKAVSPQSVVGAFVLSQIILFLLLIPRFWQRGIAVSYWQQRMLVPVVTMKPIEPPPPAPFNPDPVPVAPAPVPGV
jgi:hypothetical protein